MSYDTRFDLEGKVGPQGALYIIIYNDWGEVSGARLAPKSAWLSKAECERLLKLQKDSHNESNFS